MRHPFLPKLLIPFAIVLSSLFLCESALAAQINLAWNANIESDLAGYKVYYGTSSKSYSGSVDVGSVTAYDLTGLTDGQIYYIAVTAYNTSNSESGYSTEVSGVATELALPNPSPDPVITPDPIPEPAPEPTPTQSRLLHPNQHPHQLRNLYPHQLRNLTPPTPSPPSSSLPGKRKGWAKIMLLGSDVSGYL
jgi:hypothetical protein